MNKKLINSASEKVKNDDLIEVSFPDKTNKDLKPKKINLDIVYEDNDLIIINKKSGLVVHPGAGNQDETLVNGLMYLYKNNLSNINGDFRPGIVHRIDKDTSGLIVVAKNNQTHNSLSEQFSNHSIRKKIFGFGLGCYKTLEWKDYNLNY